MKKDHRQGSCLPPPSGVHTDRQIGTYTGEARGKEASGRFRFSQSTSPPKVRKRGGKRIALTVAACIVMGTGLLSVILPAAYSTYKDSGTEASAASLGGRICHLLLSVGLPNLNTCPLEVLSPPSASLESTTEEVTHQQEPPSDADTATESNQAPQPSENPNGVPILTLDMSQAALGPNYTTTAPSCSLPHVDGSKPLWEKIPTVLIIHSHPYEAYGDGGNYAPLSGDGFAVEVPADGSLPREGVVALGQQLATLLRLRGIQVIHITDQLSGDDALPSYIDTHAAAQAAVTRYLSLFPEIGLVIDLRRCAELLPDGSLPRTAAQYGSTPCAQLHISVDTSRTQEEVAMTLQAATALRALMFDEEPTLCRPIHGQEGGGLSTGNQAVFLTLELGSAGNTLGEAEALVPVLAESLYILVSKTG